jgi:hypothetical protein
MRNAADPVPTTPVHPTSPLANDDDGKSIRLPEDAAAWRVRRHTGGRPKHQLDGNKQPMRFPLSYTMNDIEDVLPPGAYRLDLVDGKDKYLELTIPIEVGELRNAGGVDVVEREELEAEHVSLRLPVTSSDVRLVLEANVRSMQLAFQHNERTLATGMRMAETLRDGVQVLADAQADILKSVASSRGFLRNAQPAPLALPPPKPEDSDDDDDDEDDAEDEAPADDKNEKLMAFGMAAMTLVNNLVETFRGGQRTTTGQPAPAAKSSGFDFASLLDWRRAAPQAASASPNAVEPTASVPMSPADMLRFMNTLPPELREKLGAVRSQLTPDEQRRLFPLVMAIAPEDLPAIIAELTPKPVDELVAFFRAQLATRAVA